MLFLEKLYGNLYEERKIEKIEHHTLAYVVFDLNHRPNRIFAQVLH
jgi:hypothetical protein